MWPYLITVFAFIIKFLKLYILVLWTKESFICMFIFNVSLISVSIIFKVTHDQELETCDSRIES